jgi:hypothetical protein
MDSRNILPARLAERPVHPCREVLVMQAGNFRDLGIRKGPWKLLPALAQAPKKAARPTELYRLDIDLAEANNLAAKYPEIVKELADLLDLVRKGPP